MLTADGIRRAEEFEQSEAFAQMPESEQAAHREWLARERPRQDAAPSDHRAKFLAAVYSGEAAQVRRK